VTKGSFSSTFARSRPPRPALMVTLMGRGMTVAGRGWRAIWGRAARGRGHGWVEGGIVAPRAISVAAWAGRRGAAKDLMIPGRDTPPAATCRSGR
jgi:hypothetical protein